MADPRLAEKYNPLLNDTEDEAKVEVDDNYTGSVISTGILLCSSGMGSGMFVLPYAVVQAGPVTIGI